MSWTHDIVRDVRVGARSLARSRGFTGLAVVTLAVSIGAATAMFSVLDGVMLRALPVRDQDALVAAWLASPARGTDRLPFMYHDLQSVREGVGTFAAVAGVAWHGAVERVYVDGDRTLTLATTWVTGDWFEVLGTEFEHGRALESEDDAAGAAPVMVIGHAAAERAFGGGPAAVGRTIEWDKVRYMIVGVAPRGFSHPRGAEAWIPVLRDFPATPSPDAEPSQVMVFDITARLQPGRSASDAEAALRQWLAASDPQRPEALRGLAPVVTPLPHLVSGDLRPRLWAGAGAVALLVLIACVNIANLLLVRGSGRWREFAVRSALGAGRARLVRQLVVEGTLLVAAGGALGALLAVAGVDALLAAAPADLPRRDMIAVDGRVLLATLCVTALAAVLAGVLPALATIPSAGAAGSDTAAWLRSANRSGGPPGTQALRHGLVIVQVSLAMLVVAGAGLLVRSLLALQSIEMGFNVERLVVLETALPPSSVQERERHVALQESALARVGALAGVSAAAALPARPFSEQAGWTAMFTADGQTADEQATNPWVNFEVVGPGYFTTLEVPLLRGRGFDERDREGAERVAIISEAVARHAWPGEDPIGRRVKLGPLDGAAEWHTVVGVVGETRYRELTQPWPSLYLPIRQFAGPVPTRIAVRTNLDQAAVGAQVRRILGELHADWRVSGGGSMHEFMAGPLARPRFTTIVLGTFAAIILLLAAVGIYGVMATAVRHRTREIGIRLALGARAHDIARDVVTRGVTLVAAGAAIGGIAGLVVARALRSLLFGVAPTDPLTFGAVAVLLMGVAIAACWLPARRAARVEPVAALREE